MDFLNGCWFTAGSSGLDDFDDGTAVTGFRNLANAGAVNATVYSYRAESADRSEWEIGSGAYSSGSGLIARTTIVASSNSDAKVDFTDPPYVIVSPIKTDFDSVALLNAADQVLVGGARVTSLSDGTKSGGGTYTPDPGDRPLIHITNGGAFTLAPGSNTGSYLLDITNNSSAGAITTSGWTMVSGDDFTTTDGDKFRCHASIGNAGSLLVVHALQ